jgi:hypothetical protein
MKESRVFVDFSAISTRFWVANRHAQRGFGILRGGVLRGGVLRGGVLRGGVLRGGVLRGRRELR